MLDKPTCSHKRLETLVDDQASEKDQLKVQDWVEEMTEMIQQYVSSFPQRISKLTPTENTEGYACSSINI